MPYYPPPSSSGIYLEKIAPVDSITITEGYAASISDEYEISNGLFLEISNTANLEIL
jgi:hypothetical protein